MSDALLGTTAILAVIRASSLPEYPDCSRRWAARHLWADVRAAGYELRSTRKHVRAMTGTATHVGMAHMLETKMATGDLGNLAETEQRSLDSLKSDTEQGATWDQLTDSMNTAQAQVLKQVRSYRVHVAAKLEPIAVERRLNATHAATGIRVSGQTDVIVVKPDTLRDLKTGREPGANFSQYGMYSRLGRSHGHAIGSIVEDFVRTVRPDKEQPAPIAIPYDIEACERATESILGRIAQDVARFRQDYNPEAFLANPKSTLCTPQFCPAHGTAWCRVGRAAKEPK